MCTGCAKCGTSCLKLNSLPVCDCSRAAMKNLVYDGSIYAYSSQYHHESRCANLMRRDASVCWFTHSEARPPHYVVIELAGLALIHRVGIFLHGENNQNPRNLRVSVTRDVEDESQWREVVSTQLEHRAGDHIFDTAPIRATHVRFLIEHNFGGSGIYVSKLFIFGAPSIVADAGEA